ncbi:MAG: MBL fold metallo-hydrolase [Nanobdellota archaeon]
MSRITFLGTGGDSFTIGKQTLNSGGIVIETEKMQFHLDPGPASLLMAKYYDINLRNNVGVLISGEDINLCNDVNAVIDAMTHRGLDRKGVLLANRKAYENYVTDKHKTYTERSIALDSGQRVGLNDIEIKTLPTTSDNIGYKIISSGFTISYSSDTGYKEELIKHYADSDILILNVFSPEKEKGRLSTDDAIKIASKVKPKVVIITGFGIRMIKSDPLHEARRIQKESGVQTITAKTGMSIDPISYNVKVKQKKLRQF